MQVGDLPADRESDPRPGVLIPSVQALKDHEDSFKILRFNADAVVADGEDQVLALSAGRHVDARGLLASELDRIADKILKKLGHLGLVRHHRRQRIIRHHSAALLHRPMERDEATVQDHIAVRLVDLRPRAQSRQLQQVPDKLVHALRAVHGIADECVSV